jgi:hypothetical protein
MYEERGEKGGGRRKEKRRKRGSKGIRRERRERGARTARTTSSPKKVEPQQTFTEMTTQKGNRTTAPLPTTHHSLHTHYLALTHSLLLTSRCR